MRTIRFDYSVAGGGNLPNGDWRPFLLYPCDDARSLKRRSDGC